MSEIFPGHLVKPRASPLPEDDNWSTQLGHKQLNFLPREHATGPQASAAQPDFHALFESLPGLYVVLSPDDFRIVGVSNAYLRATMTERSAILGRGLFEVFPDDPKEPAPDGVRNLRTSLERVRQKRVTDVMPVQRYPIRQPQGKGGDFEERYWSPINSPVFGPQGELAFIIHRAEDVTEFVRLKQREGAWVKARSALETRVEHMEAEIVLRASEVRRSQSEEQARRMEFETLMEAVPAVVWMAHDPDVRLITANRIGYEILGVPIGTNLSFTASQLELPRSVHLRRNGRMLSPSEAPMQTVGRTGKAILGDELEIRRADGISRWVCGNTVPLLNEHGAVRGVVATCVEITERKQAEEALRESEKKYRALYENTPAMMHSIARDGRLLSVSGYWSEHLGYEPAEVIGRKSVEFLTPESRKYAQAVVLPEYFKTGMCKDIPYQFVKKNGEIIDVLLSAIAERDTDQNVVRSLAVLIDVTAQKRAEEQIRQWNKELEARVRERTAELEAFCYSVSHDLRAPLRRIASFAQIINEENKEAFTEEGREMQQMVIESANWMNQLTEDLLRLSRLSRSEMQLRSIDLSALVQGIAAGIQKHEPQRAAEFLIAPNLVAHGDERLLRAALENLLNNAWKFTGRCSRSRIEFGTEQHDGQPAYFVRDNGIGFDMAYAGKIFGVFERLHSDADFPGTGIGLAIVQRIINRHGGKIWAQGALNQGATFYFTLP
jgi:PAS domain S-box-containing protein